METLRPTPFQFRAGSLPPQSDQVFSSSPGFGTPAFSVQPRAEPRRIPPPLAFAPALRHDNAQVVLPVELKAQVLRPVAFRNLTKKHNLTVTSSALGGLATFIGKYCGSGWREEGLAEKVLDEVAKQWKRESGGIILDDGQDKRLQKILKSLESCMSGGKVDAAKLSRSNSLVSTDASEQPSFQREDSFLEVQDEDLEDARAQIKVVSAFSQPRLQYSTTKKTLETITSTPSLLAPVHHKTASFRNRYNLVHQRLLRNEAFQTSTFTRHSSLSRSASAQTSSSAAYKLTSVSALLGRSGTSHLLLGLLAYTPAGNLALTDLTGSVVLDVSMARPIPEDGSWFCPGMIVLAEGTYEDDGSNNSNLGSAGGVGGQIKGRFLAETIAGPPAERRDVTVGTGHDHKIDSVHTAAGAGYGWFDFLGTGSEKSVGPSMKSLRSRVLSGLEDTSSTPKRTKILMFGACDLSNPSTLSAIRAVLSSCSANPEKPRVAPHASLPIPLAIVFFGSFTSAQSLTSNTFSVSYKAGFDALAALLSDFPTLTANTTLIFVPGDADPWASSTSLGSSSLLPQKSIPELFTSRIRRTMNNVNNETRRKEREPPGEVAFTSNPARVSIFGPSEELVLLRDDITGRIKRTAVLFPNLKVHETDTEEDAENPLSGITLDPNEHNRDRDVDIATARLPKSAAAPSTRSQQTARMLTKLLLDQSHLSPFPPSIRPVLWDYSSVLNLVPLPTTLVLCDAEAPAFAVTYEGCHVLNVGSIIEAPQIGVSTTRRKGGIARFVEYDCARSRGEVKEVHFNN